MSKTSIKIQEAGDDKLTLNVNGEIQTIQNQLSELKALLKDMDTQTIQYADKIYNIEHINEANFGFVTGKRAFNELLTKGLMDAIRKEDCIPAQKFHSKVQAIANWEQDARISNKAKEIIAYSFVGVIGIQLSKLMAIGKEALSEAKQQKYIHKCISLAKRTIELANFTLISSLWDAQKTKKLALDDKYKSLLKAFFDRNFEAALSEQYNLLDQLEALFIEYKLDYPFSEFDYSASKESLSAACTALQEINKTLDRGEYTLLDCTDAEKHLTTILQQFSFLVNYNMASIKRIGYKHMRHEAPRYLHRFAALGIDSKANVDAEKVMYTPDTVSTDAVLIYKGDSYDKNINLFPLVIDYNALTFEHGVKICFFQSKDLIEDMLEYRFLEDESLVRIEKKGIIKPDLDYNELMLKEENQILFNLEQVMNAYEEARTAILQETTISFDDI